MPASPDCASRPARPAPIARCIARILLPGILLGVPLVAVPEVAGHGVIPRDVPVDRIVANLTQAVAAAPDDPFARYRLGRAHVLALESKTGFVRAFERRGMLEPAEGHWADVRFGRNPKPETATPDELRTHLAEALRHLEAAIATRPTEARFRLTLACALEAGAPMMHEVDAWPSCPGPAPAPDDPWTRGLREHYGVILDSTAETPDAISRLVDGLRRSERSLAIIMGLAAEHRDRPAFGDQVRTLRREGWLEIMESLYFTAMCAALPDDGRATEKPMWGGMRNWVAYEAAEEFVRVVGARTPRRTDTIRLRIAKETIAAFDDLPRPGGITPIVIDPRGRSLREIESPRAVSFDLDGTGLPQRWTWIAPDAALLAWDPDAGGRITSGRQLFGSVSWWIFFDDGYQALDALDDDRDGTLAGRELAGLAAWFDRDGDGVSDPGEVVPLDRLGVASISCRATGRDGPALANRAGCRTRDHRVLPTYDWIAAPVAAAGADVPAR